MLYQFSAPNMFIKLEMGVAYSPKEMLEMECCVNSDSDSSSPSATPHDFKIWAQLEMCETCFEIIIIFLNYFFTATSTIVIFAPGISVVFLMELHHTAQHDCGFWM